MIPKIIHQVWVGKRNPPPWRYLETWKRVASTFGWEYRLWTDDNLPELRFTRAMYDDWDNVHARANLVEYEALYRYGGVYFDADYVSTGSDLACLPLKSALIGTTEHNFHVERQVTPPHNPRVSDEIKMSIVLQSGFLASSPSHPQLRHWLELSQSVYDSARLKGMQYWLALEGASAIARGWKGVRRVGTICGEFHISKHLIHPITIIPFQWLLQSEQSIARYFREYPHRIPGPVLDQMFEMMENGEPNSRITSLL